ncbi:MAG: GTPase Der [Candidatus Anoxychlamydiales bacterium]|nr:GTPase Der [Candidatus Anoxychlamydiales bacterium]
MIKLAIVGRPNVGKSSLFNAILKKRVSIISDEDGVTRDRIYSLATFEHKYFTLIDTGGIDLKSNISFKEDIKIQALIAIKEADVIVFVVDSKVGITTLDLELAKFLLKSKKKIVLAVNKIDNRDKTFDYSNFLKLGIKNITLISAIRNFQINLLLRNSLNGFELTEPKEKNTLNIALIGRPNVGKSTLFNSLMNDNRAIISSIAGTTRDSFDQEVIVNDKSYTFIDTAGLKRKNKEKTAVEKFAHIRTVDSIKRADVCLLLVDAKEGVTAQDKKILKTIKENQKSAIILINKFDEIKNYKQEHYLTEIKDDISYYPAIIISALMKRNLKKIFEYIDIVDNNRKIALSTPVINKFIKEIYKRYNPAMINGKRLKIYYATQIDNNPAKFIMFVNYPNLMQESYKKYILNNLRKSFSFLGSPIIFDIIKKPQKEYSFSKK